MVGAKIPRVKPPVQWVGEYRSEGELCFRLGREGARLIAEWPGCCTLRSDPGGLESELTASAGADPVLVAKIHDGLAPALLRHLQGKLTLHASAVSVEGVAVACFGESEAGKSTAIAHLARRSGAAFLADDTTAVEFTERGVEVERTERVSWLLPDARAALGLAADDRRKIAVDPLVTGVRATLIAIVKLVFDDTLSEPRIRRMHGHEALASLLPSVVRFVIDEPGAQLHEFEQLGELTRAVPIFELARPKNLAALGRTSDALIEIMKSATNGSTT